MKRLAVVLAMGLAPGAWAQPTAPVAGLPHSPAYYLLQALLSLAVVIALIYGATWLLRRVGPGRTTAGTDGPAELIQSLPLQGGYVLHVARVGKNSSVSANRAASSVARRARGEEATRPDVRAGRRGGR